MNKKLISGIVSTLQKTAYESKVQGGGEKQNNVLVKRKSKGGTPSSTSSPGMEDKNKEGIPADQKLEDDPSKSFPKTASRKGELKEFLQQIASRPL